MIEFEILWLVAFLLFLVIELITLDINVLWFIGGSSVALIVSMLGASLPIQIVTFIVFTVLSYKGTKNMKPEKTRTNSDAVIGKKGVVIRDITEMNPGQVRVQDATV
jgi:membrane protein implicated in regulation of membrane protease activity